MKLFYHEEALIITRLLIMHILADFVFQTDGMVMDKNNKGIRSISFYKHLGIVGALSWMALGQWNLKGIILALLITITHGIIDYWKMKADKNASLFYFLTDQFLHVSVLILIWLYLIEGWQKISDAYYHTWNSFTALVIVLGYLFCMVPASFIIKFATKEMIEQDKENNIKRGGRLIGIFERLIIFTFVMFHQYEAIGFLITGKSILRFADSQKKETEYVLVGTMISYGLAILTGALVNYLLKN